MQMSLRKQWCAKHPSSPHSAVSIYLSSIQIQPFPAWLFSPPPPWPVTSHQPSMTASVPWANLGLFLAWQSLYQRFQDMVQSAETVYYGTSSNILNLLTLKCFKSRMTIKHYYCREWSLPSSSGPCAARGWNWARAVDNVQMHQW